MVSDTEHSRKPAGARGGLPPALTDRIGFLLGRAHLAHLEIAAPLLGKLGLAGKEMGALAILVSEGPASQQQLSQRQGIDRTTMVAVVDALEHEGLVERRRDPTDRRAYSLHPTAKGRRALSRANEAAERAEDQFLAPLSPPERTQLKAFLRRLLS